MKRLILIFTVIAGALLCTGAKAQNVSDYYPGKWMVMALGTPEGDVKMTFTFERKDGKLTGIVQDSTGKITRNLTSIEEKDKTLTVNFTVPGYDLSLVLDPVDDDHVKGSLLGTFEAYGIRIKEKN